MAFLRRVVEMAGVEKIRALREELFELGYFLIFRVEGISEEEINLHLGCFVEIRAESNEVFETTASNLILDYLNFEVIQK